MRTNLTRGGGYRFASETWGGGIYAASAKRILLAVTAGEISVKGAVVSVYPGDLVYLSPDDICYVAEGGTFDAACWYFEDADLICADEMLGAAVYGVYPSPGQTADVRAILERAAARADAVTAQEVLLTRMMLSELLLYLPDCARAQSDEGKIALAAAYLTAHFDENVSLDTLCDSVGISKFYLCRAFRRVTGLTPHAYLNLYRVLCADRLLRSGVGAMACGERVGYRDYTTFFRSYKRIVGSAPSAGLAEATV